MGEVTELRVALTVPDFGFGYSMPCATVTTHASTAASNFASATSSAAPASVILNVSVALPVSDGFTRSCFS